MPDDPSPYDGQQYIAEITDTTTTETRRVDMGVEWNTSSSFWWEEGNFSCDCNRGSTYDGEDHECGDSRFRVKCVALDGHILYEDES